MRRRTLVQTKLQVCGFVHPRRKDFRHGKPNAKVWGADAIRHQCARIRKEKGLTQENAAEGADLHVNYISSVERGERNISICNIEKIAHALGVSMTALLDEDGPAKGYQRS